MALVTKAKDVKDIDFEELEDEVEDEMAMTGLVDEATSHGMSTEELEKLTSVKEMDMKIDCPVFKKRLRDIEAAIQTGAHKDTLDRDDPEYGLINQAMKDVHELDKDIGRVHAFLRVKYEKYFPDLKEFVPQPIAYARAVKVTGFEFDLQPLVEKYRKADFDNATIIKLLVTRSTCKRPDETSLSEQRYIIEACDKMIHMEGTLKQFLAEYIRRRMILIAPNICAIVGPGIATQVVGTVGGLESMCRFNPDALLTLGSTKKRRDAPKGHAAMMHGSFLLNCDIVKKQDDDFKPRAMKMVANKIVLAARADANRDNPDGSEGEKWRSYIERTIEGIMDGTIESSYRPGYMARKRTREQQDYAVLASQGMAGSAPAGMIESRDRHYSKGGKSDGYKGGYKGDGKGYKGDGYKGGYKGDGGKGFKGPDMYGGKGGYKGDFKGYKGDGFKGGYKGDAEPMAKMARMY